MRKSPLLSCLALASAVTHAQGTGLALEEVVVTAQKREEGLQTVPISVVVETGASLEKKGIGDLQTLSGRTPNLYIEDGGNSPNIAMRGLGSPGIESVESSVGLYIDNISLARPRGVTQSPFFDLERIEVLRGPQGTLWGRNTIVGAINVLTAAPSQELSGYVSAEAGNYDSHIGEAVISGPLVNTLSGRLSVYNARRGNYLDNPVGPDAGGSDAEAYRGQLLWEPTDNFSARLKYERSVTTQHGSLRQYIAPGPNPFNGVANSRNALIAALGEDYDVDDTQFIPGDGTLGYKDARYIGFVNRTRQSTHGEVATLNMDWEFAEDFVLTSQTGYMDYRLDRINNDGAVALNNRNDTMTFKSQEFRLETPQFGIVSFIGGIYADRLELETGTLQDDNASAMIESASGTVLRSWGGDGEKVDSWSVYGETSLDFTDELRASIGLRYGKEEKRFTDVIGLELFNASGPRGIFITDEGAVFIGAPRQQQLKRDDDYLTGSARLQYQFNPDMMAYATLATGFKSGGFNNAANTLVIENKVFDEETSIAVEIGAKLDLLDGRGRVNAALFRTEFDDLQVAQRTEQGTVITTNAAQAYTQGLELETRWRLTEEWSVGGSYSFLDAKYDDFDGAPCGVLQQNDDPVGCANGQDLAGATLQRAPRHSMSAYLEYARPLVAGWQLDGYLGWSFRDRATTEVSNEFTTDILRLVDARLQFSHPESGWSVALKGNNLTDEQALIDRNASSTLAGVQRGTITTPRTYALQVKKLF